MDEQVKALVEEVRSHARSMHDLTDSLNKTRFTDEQTVNAMNSLSATVERWNISVCWLCRLIEWRSKPWWARGDGPKSPE